FGSRVSSNVGVSDASEPEVSKADLPLMTASDPWRMSVKILLNAWSIESVRTKVPLIIATPSTIAIAVRAVRSFRLRRPRIANQVMPSASRGGELLHHVVDRVRVALADLAHDEPVGEEQHAMGGRSRARVVRHHHDRLAVLVDGAAEELEDLAARRRVEGPGWPGREQDRRLGDERTCDRDALLLATRELGGPVGKAVLEPDVPDELVEPGLVRLLSGDCQGEEDVLARVQHRQQVEELEDEADVLPAELRQVVVAERCYPRAGEADAAGGGLVQPGEDVHQGGLARARGPHDGRRLRRRDVDRDAAERLDRRVARAVAPRDVTRDDDRPV